MSCIFGVWKDCKVYMSNWQVSSDFDLIFMVQWLLLSFCVLVCFSYTVCSRSTIFGVWNDCKVYTCSWQMSLNSVLKANYKKTTKNYNFKKIKIACAYLLSLK